MYPGLVQYLGIVGYIRLSLQSYIMYILPSSPTTQPYAGTLAKYGETATYLNGLLVSRCVRACVSA